MLLSALSACSWRSPTKPSDWLSSAISSFKDKLGQNLTLSNIIHRDGSVRICRKFGSANCCLQRYPVLRLYPEYGYFLCISTLGLTSPIRTLGITVANATVVVFARVGYSTFSNNIFIFSGGCFFTQESLRPTLFASVPSFVISQWYWPRAQPSGGRILRVDITSSAQHQGCCTWSPSDGDCLAFIPKGDRN